MLYSMYPSPVQHWIANRGGLSPRMIFLRGRQLEAMYRPCYLDAQASTSKTPVGGLPASASTTPARAQAAAHQ